MSRVEKHRPFSDTKISPPEIGELKSATDKNKDPLPRMTSSDDPYTDIIGTPKMTAEDAALTEGKRYPWKSSRRSYESSTTRQG